jgi:hypothetical protein
MKKLTQLDLVQMPTEGSQAVENFAKICEKLGYKGRQLLFSNGAAVTSITDFLEDNPGCLETMYTWIAENSHCWPDAIEAEKDDEGECCEPLSDDEKAVIRADFINWSGGPGADEHPPEEVDKYLSSKAYPDVYHSRVHAVEVFINDWSTGEDNSEVCPNFEAGVTSCDCGYCTAHRVGSEEPPTMEEVREALKGCRGLPIER